MAGLVDLSGPNVELFPEFSPNQLAYEVSVSLFVDRVALAPIAIEGAQIAIDGVALPTGGTWTSPSLAAGPNVVELHVLRGGVVESRYEVTITRGEPDVYLKASNAEAGDSFGWIVALSGDANTLLVSAPVEASGSAGIGANQSDNSAPSAGAVYVFVRGPSGWSQQAYLKASNPDELDGFGGRLGISSDGNTVAVAAHEEHSIARGVNGDQSDNSAGKAGAVYVFTRSGTSWQQQAYIKASNTSDDRFGREMALSRDGNTLAHA